MRARRLLLAAVLTLTSGSAFAAAVHEYRLLQLADGTRLRHAIVLPEGFRAGETYPALLALPPGDQGEAMVEAGLERYWGTFAARRGWIVVSPMAPNGKLFHEGSERHLPTLMRAMLSRYSIEGGRFHLAGASNGGLSAFRVAREHPGMFHSLLALPGGPPQPIDMHRLDALRGLPVRMFVGGDDIPWVVRSRKAEQALRGMGGNVRLQVLEGESHAPESLEGGRVMEYLDEMRVGLGLVGAEAVAAKVSEAYIMADDQDAVTKLLDTFHDAASRGDTHVYFGCFAEDAVFLGTDPTERWTVPQFREFAEPHFADGHGWTYEMKERNVELGPDRRVAWFDEILENASYGECRGTGVAVRSLDGWRIAHYSLTFLIPNDAARAALDAARRVQSESGQ